MFNKGNDSVFTSFSGFSFVAGSNDDENIVWLGKYSEIPDINNIGNMVWFQVRKGIPEAGVLSMYSKMTDIIGSGGSLIEAPWRMFMPT